MKTKNIKDDLLQGFMESLYAQAISKVSVANYLSDINSFISWFSRQISYSGILSESFSDLLPFLKPDTGRRYKNSLLELRLPVATINRRLSSLRRLSAFLSQRAIMAFDFMQATGNISSSQKAGQKSLESSPLLLEFEKHLSLEKSSKSTVKNYVSDVRHFLTWLESKN
jgi:site-specific recombinase XerD